MKELAPPKSKPTIMSLVSEAGLDVSDWANYKRGPQFASTNPRHCYEWSFVQGDICVFNLWHEFMQYDREGAFQAFNPLTHPDNQVEPRRRRAQDFFDAVRNAYEHNLDVRVIILHRQTEGVGSADTRMLDEKIWTVTQCSPSGDFEIRRGKHSSQSDHTLDPESKEFEEGKKRKTFVTMRKREWKYRNAKISAFLELHGRLFCEVPGCGFDFELHYGEVGKGFAEVHHLDQMKDAPDEGRKATLERLAVVCSNCHRMIHRGGECRPLKEVSPMGVAHV